MKVERRVSVTLTTPPKSRTALLTARETCDQRRPEQTPMNDQLTAGNHIQITETLLRLYVFLAQELDRSLDQVSDQARQVLG